MDRSDIGNCIIAGIAEGGDVLNQMSEVITHLELAGWVIVPREPSEAMLKAGSEQLDCAHEKQCWQAMIDAALARS